MTAPLIALVAYRLDPGRVTKWSSGAFAVPDKYVDAVRRAGAEPVILPSGGTPAGEVVRSFGGLLVIGGGDVDPSLYGAEARHPHLYGVDRDRDVAEIAVIREAAEADMPILAICRGVQVLNVAFGGTLIQHLPDRSTQIDHSHADPEHLHGIRVAEGSRLSMTTEGRPLLGASRHHQGLDRLGDGLVAVGWAEDGLVEAVEHRNGWVVGVQWHPEITAHTDPVQQALFDVLANEARRAGGSS
jgi:putative glutamine amidotransferase